MGQHRAAGNRLLTIWLIWMVLSAPFSSWQGHLGGLLTGGLLGAVLACAPRLARGWIQLAGVGLGAPLAQLAGKAGKAGKAAGRRQRNVVQHLVAPWFTK